MPIALRQNLCMRAAILAGCLLFQTAWVTAQDNPVTGETATVTATINPKLQKETGRNIIIIGRETLQQFPVQSIDEVLRYAAGIEVQQRGPQGAQSDLLIRGGTFQQVLVLIDGIRLNDPLTGHFNGYIPVAPQEVERIEILKGNASALYGPDAVGGVIHIITKAFSGKKQPGGLHAGIQLQLGELGLRNIRSFFNKQEEKHYWSVGIASNNADGEQLRGIKSYFNLNTIQGAFSTQLPNNWRLAVKSALDYRKFNAQNFYTTFLSDTAEEKVNSFFNHIQVNKTNGHRVFTADAAYKILRDEYQFNNFSLPNLNRSRLFTGQILYQSRISAETEFVTGAQLMSRSIRSNDRGNHRLWHAATWFMAKHQLGKYLFMNESVRADWDDSYGWQLTPQLNISYAPNRWSFRAAMGRGIRDADFTERYNNYNKPLVTGGRIGNPELEAEETWGMEAGADYTHHPGIKVSGTLFYRKQNNLVDWAPTPYAQMPRRTNLVSTGNYALAKNIEQVNTYGAELDLYFKQKTGDNSNITFTSGITWLRSENNDSIPSFYISAHAKLLCNFGVVYEGKNILFAVNGLYKERNEQKAATTAITPVSGNYFIMNLRATARTTNKKIEIFFQAHNVFDKQYSDLLGSAMPGRWLSGGLAFSF